MQAQSIIEDALILLRQFSDHPAHTLNALSAQERRSVLPQLRRLVHTIQHSRDDVVLVQAAQALMRLVVTTPSLHALHLLGDNTPAPVDLRQRETELARILAAAVPAQSTTYQQQYQARLGPITERLQQLLDRYTDDDAERHDGGSMTGERFSKVEFAVNNEPRCAVVLVLDTSASMNDGGRIRQLNAGLVELKNALLTDSLAALRVELAVIACSGNSAQVMNVRDKGGTELPDADRAFVGVEQFVPPQLVADGATPLGSGARLAMQLISDRKALYNKNGIEYYRPWVFLITDGEPNDPNWEDAARQLREAQQAKRLISFAIGVEDADMQTLAQFSTMPPKRLRGLAFRELFLWLSKSLSAVSQSKTDDRLALPSPDSWSGYDQ